jgi:hypothetical protein
MPDITCPECGHRTELLMVRRSSDEFCSHCDYPLFWAPSSIPATSPGVNSGDTLRRLPGAGGRTHIGSKICPECGELNPLGNVLCLRCDSELDPRPPEPEPVAAPPPPPPPPPEPEPEPEPITTPRWWWVLAAVLTLGIAVPLVLAF